MTYDYSRVARERRQAVWQGGKDFAIGSVVDAALGASILYAGDPYEQYLFLLGIADHLTAVGRDLAGLDQRSTPIEGSRKR